MNRNINRRLKFTSIILLAASSLATAAPQSLAQPVGPGSVPRCTISARSGNLEYPAFSFPVLERRAEQAVVLPHTAVSAASNDGTSVGFDWTPASTPIVLASAAADGQAIDATELELMGARSQALSLLEDLVRKRKAGSRLSKPASLDHAPGSSKGE